MAAMRLLQCTKRCPRRNEAFFTIFKDKLLIRVEQKDTKGNKSVSAKYIYVDENGTPILTKDLDKYDTSNPKYLKKKVLTEVKIEETKTRTFSEWFNDEIMLNPDNIRVKNYRKAETRNPNFSQNWDMLGNIYDFTNIATAGTINRFSPTQNIRLTLDAVRGNNVVDSWMGNNGIVTDKFAENHPYWSMAINGVGDAALWFSPKRFKTNKPKLKSKKVSNYDSYNEFNSEAEVLDDFLERYKESLPQKSFETAPLSDAYKIQYERFWNGARDRLKANVDNLPPLTKAEKNAFDRFNNLLNEYYKGKVNHKDLENFVFDNDILSLSRKGYLNGFNSPTFYKTVITDKSDPNTAGFYQILRGFVEGDNKLITRRPHTRAHETVHATYIPTEPIPKGTYYIPSPTDLRNMGLSPTDIDKELRPYRYLFEDYNGTESSARLSQLKNYFGLTKDEPLTREMFEYAKRNYIKDTGYNNNMDIWFWNIIDIDKFLEWGNKHSWATTPVIGTGLVGSQLKNDKTKDTNLNK